jgi:hypothetical protein
MIEGGILIHRAQSIQHFTKDRDWLTVICAKATGQLGGRGKYVAHPDLLELTKGRNPEH